MVPVSLAAALACNDSTSPHGPAAFASFVVASNKIDSVGGTFVDTMVVQVTDSTGHYVPNVKVTWAASTGTLSSDSSVTNSNGDALVVWTFSFAPTAPIGPTVAVLTAKATAATTTGLPVGTNSVAVVGTPMIDSVFAGPGNPIPVITGGNNQSGVVGTTLPTPLTLHFADQHGNPWPWPGNGGEGSVSWAVAGGLLDTTATPGQTATTTLNTDIRSGRTTQVYLKLGSTPGANNVTVHVIGESGFVPIKAINLTFTETALVAP
jgi:hypothetical protein